MRVTETKRMESKGVGKRKSEKSYKAWEKRRGS